MTCRRPRRCASCCSTSTPARAWAGPGSTSSPCRASPTRPTGATSWCSRASATRSTLAAGDTFTTAFGNSADQSDYRWGKLHRITLPSPLGPPYTVPSAGNRFTSPLPGLPGIPVDGGFNIPDVSGHPLRADAPERFTVADVPVHRCVAQATPSGWRAVNSLAGGASEDLGSRFEQNLLRGWLTNDTYPVRSCTRRTSSARSTR